MRSRPALLLAVAALLSLGGCAAATPGAGSTPTSGGTVSIVASTDVYGSIAGTVGGSAVTVTSIIDSPSKNPHDYQATARDALAVKNADLVIVNGGGYDDFMTRLVSASGSKAAVLNVSSLSGYDQTSAGFNVHLWYDYPTMVRLVARIQAALASAAPGSADAWTAGAQLAQRQLADLQQLETGLRPTAAGKDVAITEPLPLYVLQAIGLRNRTPEAFSTAVLQGTEAPARALQETLDLVAGKQVALLVVNRQTASAQTDAVLGAARRAGIPVVGVTETLPAGQGYAAWQTRQLTAIGTALRG